MSTKKYIEKKNYLEPIINFLGYFIITCVICLMMIFAFYSEHFVYYFSGALIVILFLAGVYLVEQDFEPRKIYIKEEEIKEEE